MANYVQEMRKYIGSSPLIVPGSTIIVSNEHHEVLLQRRTDTGEWGLPGGAMEMGESLEETAAHELFEETGLRAHSLRCVDTLSGEEFYFKYPNGDEVYNVIGVYVAEEVTGELAILDGESFEQRYFSLDELPLPMASQASIILDRCKDKIDAPSRK